MSQYYTGLDVSMNETAICTVNDKGKVVFEDSVTTDPKEIDKCLKTAGFPIEKMSLESGSMSHWLMKELLALGWKISCMDARSIATVLALKQNKTDRNDARGIAEAVRSHSSYVREVYQKSQESVDLGTLLSARRSLVRQRTVLSNTMRGLLKTFGLCLGGSTVEKFPFLIRKKIAEQWPQSLIEKSAKEEVISSQVKAYPALALEALLIPFETLTIELKKIDLVLKKTVKKDDVLKRLMTAPGVGYLTALTYKVIIDEPTRFKNARAVGAYLGCVLPCMHPGKPNDKDVFLKEALKNYGPYLPELA